MACSLDDSKSYDEMYKFKKRDYSKLFAVMVKDFKYLEENTDLTKEQIEFLKEYEKPFTILTGCDHIKAWLRYEDDEIKFENHENYKQIAFRVAHNDEQKKLISEVGPIFLTSANLSDNSEIYSWDEIKKEFGYYLENKKIKFLWDNNLELEKNKTSDIFEFVWDSLEVKYLRKN